MLEPMHLFNHVSGLDIPAENEQEFVQRAEEMERENHEHAMKRRLRSSKLLEQNAYPLPPVSQGTAGETAFAEATEEAVSQGAAKDSILEGAPEEAVSQGAADHFVSQGAADTSAQVLDEE